MKNFTNSINVCPQFVLLVYFNVSSFVALLRVLWMLNVLVMGERASVSGASGGRVFLCLLCHGEDLAWLNNRLSQEGFLRGEVYALNFTSVLFTRAKVIFYKELDI